MDDVVQEIIDFFYANRHMYDRMHGKPDCFRIEWFTEEFCKKCWKWQWGCDIHTESCRNRCVKWKKTQKDGIV